MSLNGLDTAPVQEAYSQCQHEAGGWFLLKYVSRDQIELHARGKNGVHEARNAIATYSEASPLYGLIIYRRRKVLIKYIPEGTSRLLQARTAVHFQDVLERYSPYETLLEITTPDALNDTALAASFPLHTASPAIMSNKLQEISEDAEDSGATARSPSTTSDTTGSIFGTQRYNMEKRVDQIMRLDRPERAPDRPGRFSPSVYIPKDRMPSNLLTPAPPHKTSVSQYLVRDDAGKRTVSSWISSPSSSPTSSVGPTLPGPTPSGNAPVGGMDTPAAKSTPPEATDLSSAMQSSTTPPPNTSVAETRGSENIEMTEETPDEPVSAAVEKPSDDPADTAEKKDETESTRTEITPGPKADDPYDFSYLYKPKVKLGPRVVTKTKRAAAAASLPASYKSAVRKADADPPKTGASRSTTQPSRSSPVPTPPPIPVVPEYNPRPVSRGSVKSIPSHRSSASTADRSRLQKALELRKRKMQRANMQELITTPVPEEPEQPPQPVPEPIRELPTPTPSEEAREEDRTASSAASADSGVSFDDGSGEKRTEQRLSNTVSADPPIPEETPVSSPSDPPPPQISEEECLQEGVAEPPALTEPDTVETSAGQETLPIGASYVESAPLSEPESQDEEPATSRATDTAHSTDAAETKDLPPLPVVQHRPTSSHASTSEISDAAEEDFSTPQSVKKDPIDQAEIIASLQRAASDSPRDLPLSPRHNKPTLPAPIRLSDRPVVVQEAREWDSEPTMSLEMLDEISIAFMPTSCTPGYAPISYKPDKIGLGIQASRTGTVAGTPPSSSANQSSQDRETTLTPAWTPLRQQGQDENGRAGEETVATDDEDEELLDELETATLHEAGSVTMSAIESNMRKPSMSSMHSTPSIRPVNIRRVSSLQQETAPTSPMESGPVRTPSHARSLTPRPIEVYEPSGIARTGNVSLGISKRIDTLEEATAKGPSPSYQSAIVDALQKSVTRSGSISPSGPGRNARSTSPNMAPVSVHARIVKPRPNAGIDEPASFQKSELVMNYRRSPQTPKIGVSPIRDEFPTSPANRSAPSTHTAQQSVSSVADSEESSNKEGRASRIFKRVSNWSVGTKRRSNTSAAPVSPTTSVPEVPGMVERTIRSRGGSEPPSAVMVGDLNVQFPDSLLWKRRIVEIDDTGHIVFSGLGNANGQKNSGTPKKYHLRDFKIPYSPDLERQELPCSLVLDFLDGTPPIQVACEDSATQREVLFILRTHWKSYAGI